jgi:hypothetical protein
MVAAFFFSGGGFFQLFDGFSGFREKEAENVQSVPYSGPYRYVGAFEQGAPAGV